MIGGSFKYRKLAQKQGFTIVETLIVLAVTGVLFVSVIAAFGGRQQQVEFTQGINLVKTEIEQAMNEVETGYYPNAKNFKCQELPDGSLDIDEGESELTATEQGKNTGCLFLGKVLQFGIDGDMTRYDVLTIVGRQSGESFIDATPQSIESAREQRSLQFGLTLARMTYNEVNPVGAVGFFTSYGVDDSGMASGNQVLQTVPVIGTGLGAPANSVSSSRMVNGYDTASNPPDGIQICLVSAGTDQSGLFTIGGNDRANSVTLEIKNNRNCT